MPVRSVSNRGGNVIGYYPSIKVERLIAFESTIERDFLYFLDFEPHIASYSEQPFAITYLDNGKKRTYTPDFEVSFTDGSHFLIECKPEELLDSAKNQPKFSAGRAWCHEHSWEYEVVTDSMLRRGYRLRNVKLLMQNARQSIPPTLKNRMLHFLEHVGGSASIQEIVDANMDGVITRPIVLSALFQMLYFHALYVEMNDRPIGEDSVVALNSFGKSGNEYTTVLGR